MIITSISVLYILSLNQVYTYTSDVQNYRTGLNWYNAVKHCGPLGLEYELPILQRQESLQNNEFWIGIIKYKERTPWIQPIGCFKMEGQNTFTEQETVGYCQNECNRQLKYYFGYMKRNKRCYCLTSQELSKYQNNLSNCQQDQTDIISVYSRFNHSGLSEDGTSKCLLSKCVTNQVFLHPQICDQTNSTIQTLCHNKTSPQTVSQTWGLTYESARQTCMRDNKLLLLPSVCINDQLAWTNVFREEILVQNPKEKPNAGESKYCVSGRRTDSDTKLTLHEKPCIGKLEWFVCRTNLTTETFHRKRDSENTSSGIGPIAGGVTAGLVTVILIVVVVLFLLRKQRMQDRVNSGHGHDSNDQVCTNAVDKTTNNNYDRKEEDIHRPEYAVVQKFNHPKLPTPEETYAIAREDEYDQLNYVSNRKLRSDVNIYDIEGKCEKDEYDTMKSMQSSNKMKMDNLYDRNIVAYTSKVNDPEYDSAVTVKLTNRTGEDFYDQSV